MSPSPATDATCLLAPMRRVWLWLVAMALLLQTLWVPYHLASEHHGLPGTHRGGPCVCGAEVDHHALVRSYAEMRNGTDPVPEPPHSALEHKEPKQRPAEDAGPQVPPLAELPPGNGSGLIAAPPCGAAHAAVLAHLPRALRAPPSRPRAPPAV